MELKTKKRLPIVLIIIAVIIVALILGIVLFVTGSDKHRISKQLRLGEKYLEELDYEAAIAAYEKVLEIDPKNVEAYEGIIEAYIAIGNYNKAFKYAEKALKRTKDSSFESLLQEIDSKRTAFDRDVTGDAYAEDEESWNDLSTSNEVGSINENVTYDNGNEIDDSVLPKSKIDYGDYRSFSMIQHGVSVVNKRGNYGAVDYLGNVIADFVYDGNWWQAPNKDGYFGLSKWDDGTTYYIFGPDGHIVYSGKNEVTIGENSYVVMTLDGKRLDDDFNTFEGSSIYDYYKFDGTYLTTTKIEGMSTSRVENFALGGAKGYDQVISIESFNLGANMRIGLMDADGNIAWGDTLDKYRSWLSNSFLPLGVSVDGCYLAYDTADLYMTGACYRIFKDSGAHVADIKIDSWYPEESDDGYNPYGYNSILGYRISNTTAYNYGTKVVMEKYDYDEERTTSYGLFDFKDGTARILCEYEYIGMRDSTYWLISDGNRWGYIDHDGNTVKMYDDASDFSLGYAGVIIDGIGYIIDESFNIVQTIGPSTSTSATIGYIRFERESGTEFYITSK